MNQMLSRSEKNTNTNTNTRANTLHTYGVSGLLPYMGVYTKADKATKELQVE